MNVLEHPEQGYRIINQTPTESTIIAPEQYKGALGEAPGSCCTQVPLNMMHLLPEVSASPGPPSGGKEPGF